MRDAISISYLGLSRWLTSDGQGWFRSSTERTSRAARCTGAEADGCIPGGGAFGAAVVLWPTAARAGPSVPAKSRAAACFQMPSNARRPNKATVRTNIQAGRQRPPGIVLRPIRKEDRSHDGSHSKLRWSVVLHVFMVTGANDTVVWGNDGTVDVSRSYATG